MSQWTHVNIVIRLDGFNHHNPALRAINAATCPPIPVGSEGPIKAGFHYTGDTGPGYSSINIGTVCIHGDLRDFGDAEVRDEIVPWLEKLPDLFWKRGYFFRDVIGHIDVELGPQYIVIEEYDENKEGTVKSKLVLKKVDWYDADKVVPSLPDK